MTALLVPGLFLLVFAAALRRRVDLYSALTDGASEGLRLMLRLLPPLIVLLPAAAMLRASGVTERLASLLSPALSLVGLPPETAPILLLRPISGSAAMAAAADLMAAYGPDSRIGLVSAVMLGSTETTFYTISVYFGAAKVRSTRHAVPAALIADLTGFVSAALAVRLFFPNV